MCQVSEQVNEIPQIYCHKVKRICTFIYTTDRMFTEWEETLDETKPDELQRYCRLTSLWTSARRTQGDLSAALNSSNKQIH